MRRWRYKYQKYGYDGLFDRRKRRPSPRRVPLEKAQRVLRLYREQYHDYNVRHFHEKLVEEHGIKLSYQWVKTALQTAGMVAKHKKRGPHRMRRERKVIRGMMVHCDGSKHGWIPLLEGKKHDLISVCITDPRELALPRTGMVELQDAETGETLLVDTTDKNVRKGFRLLAEKRLSDTFEKFRSTGVDYIDIRTNVPYIDPIMKFFRMREKRL